MAPLHSIEFRSVLPHNPDSFSSSIALNGAWVGSAAASICIVVVVLYCACCTKKEEKKEGGDQPGAKGASEKGKGGKAGGSAKSGGSKKEDKDKDKDKDKPGEKTEKTGKASPKGKAAAPAGKAEPVPAKGAAGKKGAKEAAKTGVAPKGESKKPAKEAATAKAEPKAAAKGAKEAEKPKPFVIAKSVRSPAKPKQKKGEGESKGAAESKKAAAESKKAAAGPKSARKSVSDVILSTGAGAESDNLSVQPPAGPVDAASMLSARLETGAPPVIPEEQKSLTPGHQESFGLWDTKAPKLGKTLVLSNRFR